MMELLQQAIAQLKAAGCETPQLDAEVLLAHVLGCERYELYTAIGRQSSVVSQNKFNDYIERRMKREPVAYITGFKEFWSMPIKVTPAVLIPRPETESLVEQALQKGGASILDLCTGSGCIAAALAKELPQAQITVSDISKEALAVARENLKFAGERITFVQGSLFENIQGPFDLIVSNPPYIPTAVLSGLEPEVNVYEPRLALGGGADGLDFVRNIRRNAPKYLKKGGWLLMEVGPETEVMGPAPWPTS